MQNSSISFPTVIATTMVLVSCLAVLMTTPQHNHNAIGGKGKPKVASMAARAHRHIKKVALQSTAYSASSKLGDYTTDTTAVNTCQAFKYVVNAW
jgi:hypothetical protein